MKSYTLSKSRLCPPVARWFMSILGAAIMSSNGAFAATEYSRSQDFNTTSLKSIFEKTHVHGGFLAGDTTRWSYYLVTAKQRQECQDLGALLGNPEQLIPLTGFSATAVGSENFSLYSYKATDSDVKLIWNYNASNPQTELARADIAIFFHPPEAGTYSINGELLWRNTTRFSLKRGAGLEIGVLQAATRSFASLFKAEFATSESSVDPKPVPEFANNPSLQNLKLAKADRIVFLWHSDNFNYRGLEGTDKDVRIVHTEGKPLPNDPEEIAKLSSIQRLFSLMDLDRTELAAVRDRLQANDYTGAAQIYINDLAARLAKLPKHEGFGYWLYGVAAADQLLDGKLTTVKYGDVKTLYTFEIGKPGHIDFFKAANAEYNTTIRDISSMQWASKHAEAYQKTKDPKYLQAWLATWDDFARNWDSQYATVMKDPAIGGKRPDGRRNLLGIDWLNAQLYLAWRLHAMHAGLFACLQTAHENGQIGQIDPGMLSRILIRAVTCEAARSRTWLDRAEALVPNQIRHLATVIFTWGNHFPEFRDSAWWREKAVPCFTMTHLPDGTDREHSLNYFANNLKEVLHLLQQLPKEEQNADLLATLEQKSRYRDLVIPSLTSPDGSSPTVGKNNIWRNYGQTKPFEPPSRSFTSILFPYNGFAIQRDGWQPDSLYLFMRSDRPSIGHHRDQDGGLQLSAYGRNLLVSAIGEMYDDRNSKWSDYFYTAVGQNTILADGMSHKRRTTGFEQLDTTLWHTSDNIEFMETEMSGVYSGWGSAAGGEKWPEITDVTHRRQVHFLRQAKCWIVTDRVSSEKPHDFTQTWCFGPEFQEGEIVMDSAIKQIQTIQPNMPNLNLYQFAALKLDYKKYFGLFSDKQILGWSGILADREKWWYTPKVDTHVNWHSQGKQIVITLMVPSSNEHSPVKSVTAASQGTVQGFDAELNDGTRIFYRAAPEASALAADGITAEAKSLVVVRYPENNLSGMVLGALRFEGQAAIHPNLEFKQPSRRWWQLSKLTMETTPVAVPDSFHWTGSGQDLKPVYQKQ